MGLVFDEDFDLHAVGAVAGDGADEVVRARLVERDGGVAVGVLGAQGRCGCALREVVHGAYFHHVVHLLHVVELCNHEENHFESAYNGSMKCEQGPIGKS